MGPVENLKFAMQRGRRGDSHRCGHLGMIRVDTALTADCVPCVRSGDTWVHLVRGGSLADSMSDYLIRTLRQTPNIDIRYHAEVVGASGERRLQRLKIRDTSTAAPDHRPPSQCSSWSVPSHRPTGCPTKSGGIVGDT